MKIRLTVLALLLALPPFVCAAEKPNIVLILADDMGFMDLSCNGSDLYRTPNIDRLATQGTRFTNAYSAGHVCSPTRASLLTGKYPARLHITDWIAGHEKPFAKLRVPKWTKKLPETELSLAKLLKPQGYATAWIGKWHLGGGAQDHGFEAGAQHWNLNRKQDPKDPKGVYTLTAEAIDFISRHRDHPFLATISHYSPHSPLRAEAGAAEKYEAIIAEKKPRQTNAVYAGMVEALDKSVGQLLDWLDKNQLAENTLVIFTSDNGGQLGPTNNAPLRGGKGTHYGGGVRVPFVARWPGKIPAGATNDARICSIDFLPTCAALAGATVPMSIDGMDVTAVLTGKAPLTRDTLHWHYPHYHNGKPSGAILQQNWKLLEWFETGEIELFDLAVDSAESTNLAASHPEKRDALLAELRQWRTKVGAQMMSPNPDFDAARANAGPEKKLKKKQAEEE